MEPPPVQYVRTEDGFDIAYTVAGEGLPFVFMPWPFSHRGLWWRSEFGRPLSEALAQRFRLVQYDSRAQGMSTRGLPEDHCIDDYLTDLEAVVDRVGLDRFVLFGCPVFGHVAVKYAVQHPDRVLALVLGNQLIDTAWGSGVMAGMARQNWDAFLYLFAAGNSVAGAPIETHYWRESLTREDFFIMELAARESDISDLLPQIKAPTHVGAARFLRDGKTPSPYVSAAQTIAALIPNSRLDIFDTDGDALMPDDTGVPPLVRCIEALLRDNGLFAREAGPALDATALSPREIEVLRLVVAGKSNLEIASELVLSVRTVERHISNIYAKARVRGKGAAIAYALRNGLA